MQWWVIAHLSINNSFNSYLKQSCYTSLNYLKDKGGANESDYWPLSVGIYTILTECLPQGPVIWHWLSAPVQKVALLITYHRCDHATCKRISSSLKASNNQLFSTVTYAARAYERISYCELNVLAILRQKY